MLRAAGHIGLFAGMYVVGALVCVWQLSGLSGGARTPSWATMLAVGLIATGTYALDRVKLRDAWMDPADRTAQPERYAFLGARARSVRWGTAACLIAGAALGELVHPLAAGAAMLAAIGVIAYAPRARTGVAGGRIKDRLGIKNLYVAAGIAGFAALATVADAASSLRNTAFADPLRAHWGGLAAACMIVGFRVMCDAAICDLDDEHADRAHGTRTLPTVVGGRRAWRWTGIARMLTPLLTLACVWCPWRARVAWAVVSAAGVVALRARRPRKVRDFVDVRLAIEAAVATCVLLGWDG